MPKGMQKSLKIPSGLIRPHPPTPSPKIGEGERETLAP
jgi:hypothetical protein